MIDRVKRAFQAMLPNGQLNGPWQDKYNGADLEKYIEGLSGQYTRDVEQADKVRRALDPYKTTFVDELDREFGLPLGTLTEAERRGRLDGRFRLMVETKLRVDTMEEIFHLAGFTTVQFRTLGWNGVPETPQDFFDEIGQAYYGNTDEAYGSDNMIYGASSNTGSAYLITNGGSVDYADIGTKALSKLKSEAWYFGAYFICESNTGDELAIPERLYETFWDLLYLVKPAKMHGILRAQFV